MAKIYNEEELLVLCRKNDRKAQQELYQRYSRRMYALCLRYCGNQMEAEDLMITGFMKIFSLLDRYEAKGSLEGWMRRIMVNEALMALRKKRTLYAEVSVDYAEAEVSYQDLSSQLHAEELLALVQALPAGYRTVFNLFALEGYSHKEIADLLGISENTSKSQLSRARALLQEQVLRLDGKTKRINS